MRGTTILDAHIHRPTMPMSWDFGKDSEFVVAVELAREAMDSVGVDGALINAEEGFIDAAVGRYPARFAGAGNVDIRRPDLEEFVAEYRCRPGRLALRVFVRDPRTDALSEDYLSGAMEPLFAAARKQDLPIFLCAQEQLQAVSDILRSHPDQMFILDHIGMSLPVGNEPWADLWKQLPTVNALATYPNLAIKFCGGETRSREPFPHRDVWPKLMTTVEAFGPDRLMWASDFTRMRKARNSAPFPQQSSVADPWDSRNSSSLTVDVSPDRWLTLYGDQVHFIRETSELSASDKEKILSSTITKVLRWEFSA